MTTQRLFWSWYLVALFWLSIVPAVVAQERLALLIGNQGYHHSVGELQNPHNDIRLMQRALTDVGFQTLPLVKDATRDITLQATYQFAQKLKSKGPNAIGFLYYSGHGIAGTKQGPNYIVPTDLKSLDEISLQIKGVKLNELVDIVSRIAPKAALFMVFDACRNELRGSKGSKGFVPMIEKAGVLIAYSTAPGDTASDLGERGGPYATTLAREIRRSGQHHLDLFFNIRKKVIRATRGRQVPWVRDGLTRRVFFAGLEAPTSAQTPVASNKKNKQDDPIFVYFNDGFHEAQITACNTTPFEIFNSSKETAILYSGPPESGADALYPIKPGKSKRIVFDWLKPGESWHVLDLRYKSQQFIFTAKKC